MENAQEESSEKELSKESAFQSFRRHNVVVFMTDFVGRPAGTVTGVIEGSGTHKANRVNQLSPAVFLEFYSRSLASQPVNIEPGQQSQASVCQATVRHNDKSIYRTFACPCQLHTQDNTCSRILTICVRNNWSDCPSFWPLL